jgi:triphosphatase
MVCNLGKNMTAEIELKLSASTSGIERLKQHRRLQNVRCKTKQLFNQYFDTPEQSLSIAQAALRVRNVAQQNESGQFIQTLKTRGQSLAGLSQRQEWEWPVESALLDVSILSDHLPDNINASQLQSLFKTDFQRLEYLIEYNNSQIELVIDQGEVSAVSNGQAVVDVISEVELELKSGNADDLFALSIELNADVSLMINDVSKAERGYRLLNGLNARKHELLGIKEDQTAFELFKQLFSNEMELALRSFESFSFTRNWQYLANFRRSQTNLRSLLTFFSPLIEQASHAINHVRAINSILDNLCGWWPEKNALSNVDKTLENSIEKWCEQQAIEKADMLLEHLVFSQHLLQLGAWLYRVDVVTTHASLNVAEFVPQQLRQEWQQLDLAKNNSSVSQWLSAKSRAAMLHLLTQKMTVLSAESDAAVDQKSIAQINQLLMELAATDDLLKNKEWLASLDTENYSAAISQTRKNTILVGALNQLV